MDHNTYILRHLKLNSVSDIWVHYLFEVGSVSFSRTIAIA